MPTFRLFSLFSGLLSRHFQQRSDEVRLRQELLAYRRRELLHRNIPDVYAARADFGSRFDELLQLLLAHDPAALKQGAADSPYYPELARTLLYQLTPSQSEEQVFAILQQELSLWFGYPLSRAEETFSLAKALFEWRISW